MNGLPENVEANIEIVMAINVTGIRHFIPGNFRMLFLKGRGKPSGSF